MERVRTRRWTLEWLNHWRVTGDDIGPCETVEVIEAAPLITLAEKWEKNRHSSAYCARELRSLVLPPTGEQTGGEG